MRQRLPLLVTLIALATSILLVSAASQTKPQTNEKNSFSAAEAEERSKIHGSWSVGALPDVEQAKAETVPVVLDRVEVFIGGGKKYAGMLKVTGATLNNRSLKPLRGVEIKWRIARKDDPAAALEGAVSPIETTIGANSRQHIDIPVINFTTAAQPLLKREFTYAEFIITLSVSKAVFADGTTWEEANSVTFIQASWHQPLQEITCFDSSGCRSQTDFPYQDCYSDEGTANVRCNLGPCNEYGCGCGTDIGYGGACPSATPPPDCSEAGFLPIDGRSCHSPILIDVAGDGFRLTNAADGVNFDLDRDGRAERLAWTEAGSDDAWLVFDRFHDGKITGEDMFGNYTAQPTDVSLSERNGFLALRPFDLPANGGNGNGIIDAGDSVFASLRLWQDKNHNGIAEPAELHTLPSLNIEALALDYKESRKRDSQGNEFKYRAKVYGANHSDTGRWAYDVFLLKRP